jgi:hypothetical protein
MSVKVPALQLGGTTSPLEQNIVVGENNSNNMLMRVSSAIQLGGTSR